ncbi:NUDIX domain-containing protein [Pseudonocardia sediminis]|uniref:NUDIX domain-containing protein n=2 Tax=Pseudonocardia sediminis TaxID=1397368 RepID=A0A4Q7V1T4_PSEST|nr:NUDIX domain-containing protein [Pseudonocardia sediminis]
MAVVLRGADILVSQGRDPVKGETFHRLLGGGIEFGEPAEEALRREMREEIAVELTGVERLGVVENIFVYDGEPGHEIVFLYSATVADPAFYDRDDLGTVLDEGSPVLWLPLQDVVDGRAILYPTGVIDLVRPG